ncbi:unnamed protein product [Trichobilharzia regenti]|nr:unnamed protein product [Trichobilharzia regenti]
MIVLQYLDENLKLWLDQMSGVEVKCPTTFYRLGSLDSHSSLNLKDMQLVSSSDDESDEQGDEDGLEISNEKAKEDLHQPYISSVHAANQPVENFNTQYEAVDSDDYSPPSNLQQTVFITTRVIRRHSLPETQLAIRKTFNFSLSNKPSNVEVINNTSKCLPVSNTDIRSVQKSLRLKESKLEQKTLDFNSEHSFLRFAALAHRRSSAPITEH